MHHCRLGRTELHIPRLGFGGLGIVDRYLRRWGNDGALHARNVVYAAFEHGVTLFETARWYGNSEKRIGSALHSCRSDCCFVSKTMRRDSAGALADVKDSLRALLTDYIDVYMIHHVQWEDELKAVLSPGGALEGLKRAQARGQIGFVGIAAHRPELISIALATGEFDVVQIPCNVLDPWIFRQVLTSAKSSDTGVIGMKAIAGGQLSKHAIAALRFSLGQPCDCLVVGMSTVKQVRVAVRETTAFGRLNQEMQQQLAEESLYLGKSLCRLDCGEMCMPLCPFSVPIPGVLRLERYRATYKSGHWAKEEYRHLGFPAERCEGCAGYCVKGCPHGLPVQDMLLDAHYALLAPVTDYEIAQHGGEGAVATEIAP